MPKAVASTRVSTDEQVESGLGLAAQEASCRLCAARLGLELASVHADEGFVRSIRSTSDRLYSKRSPAWAKGTFSSSPSATGWDVTRSLLP
jgi:hypothetical protein